MNIMSTLLGLLLSGFAQCLIWKFFLNKLPNSGTDKSAEEQLPTMFSSTVVSGYNPEKHTTDLRVVFHGQVNGRSFGLISYITGDGHLENSRVTKAEQITFKDGQAIPVKKTWG